MSTIEQALMARESSAISITPVMNLEEAKQRLKQFQAFVSEYLKEGEDYGRIPGTPKPTLLKPGADKLCELYGLADTFEIIAQTTDWDRGLFEYEFKCRLVSRRDGSPVSEGVGSCNSFEGKYRWRESKRVCPMCGQETIIKGKAEFGGGWLCFKKTGGCGAKWKDGAEEIESQVIGRVENDDVATLKNTIMKMAKKRAKIDATLSATRSSGIFTQDMEDIQESSKKGTATKEQEGTGPTNLDAVKDEIRTLLDHDAITQETKDKGTAWLAGNVTLQACLTFRDKLRRAIIAYEATKHEGPESVIEIQSDDIQRPQRKRKAEPDAVGDMKPNFGA